LHFPIPEPALVFEPLCHIFFSPLHLPSLRALYFINEGILPVVVPLDWLSRKPPDEKEHDNVNDVGEPIVRSNYGVLVVVLKEVKEEMS
jgi:hypothetical protein